MRNSASLFLSGVFFIGAGIAQAAPPVPVTTTTVVHDRLFRLECKFIGATAAAVVGKKGGAGALVPHECTADVQFCRHHHNDNDVANGGMATNSLESNIFDDLEPEDCLKTSSNDRARLRIACDGAFIFRDRAFREHFAGHEFIFGIPNQLPVVKLPLDQFDLLPTHGSAANVDVTRVVNAWLNVGPTILEGFCAVRAIAVPSPKPTVTYTPSLAVVSSSASLQ